MKSVALFIVAVLLSSCKTAGEAPPDPAIVQAQARVYEAVAARMEARMNGDVIAPPAIPEPVSFVERIPAPDNPDAGRQFRMAPSQPLATVPPFPSDE